MRRWGRAAVVGLGVALALLLAQTGEPDVQQPLAVVAKPAAPMALPVAPEAADGSEQPVAVDDDEPVFQRIVERAKEHCGFQTEGLVCADGRCAALVQMPNLDHVQGWAQIAAQQPVFVASTLARDLGIPLGWSPCVQAMQDLPQVVTVPLDGDRDLWCVGDTALCEERSGVLGFTALGARRLGF